MGGSTSANKQSTTAPVSPLPRKGSDSTVVNYTDAQLDTDLGPVVNRSRAATTIDTAVSVDPVNARRPSAAPRWAIPSTQLPPALTDPPLPFEGEWVGKWFFVCCGEPAMDKISEGGTTRCWKVKVNPLFNRRRRLPSVDPIPPEYRTPVRRLAAIPLPGVTTPPQSEIEPGATLSSTLPAVGVVSSALCLAGCFVRRCYRHFKKRIRRDSFGFQPDSQRASLNDAEMAVQLLS